LYFFTQIQIKHVLLVICVSLVAIGFAAPAPPGYLNGQGLPLTQSLVDMLLGKNG
jgi:hypothetical protein